MPFFRYVAIYAIFTLAVFFRRHFADAAMPMLMRRYATPRAITLLLRH